MTVKVVADSTADIPPQIAEELGITVVPLYVHFGQEVYRDGVDLDADEFYRRLAQSPALPTTSAPSPATFTEVYSSLAQESNEIISLHISAKLSATCNSASLGKEGLGEGCRVEVVDSLSTSMGFGLLAILAARTARSGASLDQVLDLVRQAIPRSRFFGLLDTLEYVHKGGRIGKAQAFLGTLLRVKPLLAVRDGEVYPLERVRSRGKGLERMCQLVEASAPIEEMAVIYSTTPDEAEELRQRLGSIVPRDRIHMAQFGPVMGTYTGPGSVGVALIEGVGSR